MVLGACDDGPPEPPREPPAPSRELGMPGAPSDEELPAPSPWPTEIEDLTASVERFHDVASCEVRLREQIPVEVVDVIADVGYDQLLEDACRSVAAVRAGNVDACDALSVSSARRGCRRRLAVVHGRPDVCPEDSAAGGREATCVAWASRDAELCSAASEAERTRCMAVLSGDVAACERAMPTERVRCRAEIARLGPALGESRVEREGSERLAEPSFRLIATVTELGGATRAPIMIERDVLDRGVVLAADGCAWIVPLERTGGDRAIPTSFIDRDPVAAVQVRVPPGAELPLEVPIGATTAQVMVSLPGVGTGDSTAGATGTVTVRAFAPERGARIEVAVDATLAVTPHRVHVEGTLVTFVRDREALATGCEG